MNNAQHSQSVPLSSDRVSLFFLSVAGGSAMQGFNRYVDQRLLLVSGSVGLTWPALHDDVSYYPPDFDPKEHDTLNAYHGKHALGDRARKLKTGGGLIVSCYRDRFSWGGGQID
jgi:hypothetical protein